MIYDWGLKLLGGALITAGCALAGIRYSKRETLRSEGLNDLKRGLLQLKSASTFMRASLADAFRDIGANGGQTAAFFRNVALDLTTARGSSFPKVWSSRLPDLKAARLEPEDLRKVDRLGLDLGVSDTTLQNAAKDMLTDYIDLKRDELAKSTEKNGRLYRTLGVLCGLFITIIIF